MSILLYLLAYLAVIAAAAPAPKSVKSSVILLIDNDLQGQNGSKINSGVLVLEAQSLKDATAACQAWGEQLWSPEQNSTTGIRPNLNYLKYTKKANGSSQFWIAPNGQGIRAIDANGKISRACPSARLPAFCTQSAPFSNGTVQDTSDKWQVTVHSNNEFITGFRDRYSFRFQGVRYAPPPKRFTYSVPYVGSGNKVLATEFGPQCVQSSGGGSEDCLFLNVWTNYLPDPKSPKYDLKPVMVFIHGGAFTAGTGNDPHTDGGNLASRGDVVVVAVDYRLGTLGFLALDDGKTNGNFGIADQINALDWVRKNIKDFGGDPDHITIFGQSAGASSVRALIASPQSIGKFAGAIVMSNPGGIYGITYSKYYSIDEEMKVAGNAILNATSCANASSPVDCLRLIPAEVFPNLTTVASYPVVDGAYLTTDELDLSKGSPYPFRLMMGITRDDGASFLSFPKGPNETEYLNTTGIVIPSPDLFPIDPTIQNKTLALFDAIARLSTDGTFRCIDHATAYAGLQNNRFVPDVFLYEFNRTYQPGGGGDVCKPAPTAEHPYGDPDLEYSKCHAGELQTVFGNLARSGLPMRDGFDLPFEQFALDSFAAFGRTFDPNPDLGFLTARGYENTIEEIAGAGRWVPSTKKGMTMRTLEWPSFQGPLVDLKQCEAIGIGLDYYLK